MHGLNSSYHALQVSVDKRYSPDFTVGASYTWSKNLDYASSNGFGGSRGVNNPFNFFFSRGNSDYTRTHRFVNSFVWDLPRLKGKPKADAILGNWRLSSIITLMSGRPFSIGASNNSIAGAGSARADLIGSGYPILDTGRSKGAKAGRVFRQNAVRQSCPEYLSALSDATSLFGPGFANIDTSLAKGWRLPFMGEQGKVEYRFEAFNALNATHLGNPTTGLTNPNFGKITGTAGDPRILQMALKVAW